MLESYDRMSIGQKDTFKDICNRLLAQTFISRDKKDNKESYYFIINFKSIFDEFFKILGIELLLDANLGSIMIKSDSNSNILKLKRDESIILLILRLLYHEKIRETSLNDNVICSITDIHTKYDYLEIKRKINKTDLIASLRLFRKYNLIEVAGDIQNSSSKVVIFPTILMAISTEDINIVFDTITKISQSEVE